MPGPCYLMTLQLGVPVSSRDRVKGKMVWRMAHFSKNLSVLLRSPSPAPASSGFSFLSIGPKSVGDAQSHYKLSKGEDLSE